jgi:hypothetical protein
VASDLADVSATATLDRAAMPASRLDRPILVVSSVVVIGAFMSILDATIVNVALATLSRELHSPLHTVQWVATGYLVALAVVIPLTGWASERLGARRLWMLVVALFVAGSALCGLAWSAGSLVFFRVLQGLGGGMIMPAGMTILAQAAGPQRIGRVMSVVGVPMLLGPVLGPVLGGADPREGDLALDLLRERADRCDRAGAGGQAPAAVRAAARRAARRPGRGAAVPGALRDRVRAVGDLELRRHRKSRRMGADRGRGRARRSVHPARPAAARPARAARPEPVPLAGLRRRRRHGPADRRRGVRCAARDAAVLPARR